MEFWWQSDSILILHVNDGLDIEHTVDHGTHFAQWGFGSAVGSSTTMMGACCLLSSVNRLEQNKQWLK